MHFYGLTHREVLDTPIKTFWLLSSNIERITAQKDLRELTVLAHSQSVEGATELTKRLIDEIGLIAKEAKGSSRAVFSEERDEEGFAALKAMSV